MTTIVTRASKGDRLTHAEVDANFDNLNGDKIEKDGSIAFTGSLDLSGNQIINAGNIDGRDVSADGSKLDGIESGATADQTDAEIEAAYNNEVAKATQTEAENPSNTTVHRWAPQQVHEAAAVQADNSLGKIRGVRTMADSGNTVADDRGKMLEGTKSTAMTITLDDDVHGQNDVFYIVQGGAGQITVQADTNGLLVYADSTFNPKTLEQGAMLTVICVDATPGANVFRLGGQLELA